MDSGEGINLLSLLLTASLNQITDFLRKLEKLSDDVTAVLFD